MDRIGMDGSAVISRCGRYRYALGRMWNRDLGSVLFVGLNPSTADATTDDPTIRRCVGFARAWGYGSLVVVNLFAFRSTQPERLRRVADPIGRRNNWWLGKYARRADLIVAAWGVHGALLGRDAEVLAKLSNVHCLGVTRGGHPRHPLYLSAAVRPRRYGGDHGRFSARREAGMLTH